MARWAVVDWKGAGFGDVYTYIPHVQNVYVCPMEKGMFHTEDDRYSFSQVYTVAVSTTSRYV